MSIKKECKTPTNCGTFSIDTISMGKDIEANKEIKVVDSKTCMPLELQKNGAITIKVQNGGIKEFMNEKESR